MQTRLTDFDESTKDKKKKQDSSEKLRLPTGELWEKTISNGTPSVVSGEPSEGEVELELLKRKEATKGGM